MKLDHFETVVHKSCAINLHGAEFPYEFFYEKAVFEDKTEVTAYAYTAKGENRPVLFLTNGGPGSGVVWLHIGFCAPKRIHLDNDLEPQMTPPFYLEDNPSTLIDTADLVFIDPPGAGYSNLNPETQEEYTSVDGDAAAVAFFIERWRIEHRMCNRPSYFMGESYGTVRGPALLDALMGGSWQGTGRLNGICLDGIILLGSVVSVMNFDNWTNPPVPLSVLNLECCAAAYAFHTGKDYRKAAEEAWAFTPEYVQAIYTGNNLSETKRRAVAQKLHKLLGLPVEKFLSGHLQYTMNEFLTQAIPGKMIGYYDGRYLMDGKGKPQDVPYPGSTDPLAEDPAMGQYSTAFIQGQELFAAEMDLPMKPYPLINCAINKKWGKHSRHTTLQSLENAQRRNRNMRILFQEGLFDMCTVPGGVRFVVSQSDLDPARVDIKEYASGHMAYFGNDNAAAMCEDIRNFLLNK